MSEKIRELAKCIDFDLMLNNGCSPMLSGHFAYEDCGCQGIGYIVEIAFLARFMGVFSVEKLRDVNRKSCWVTHDSDRIYKIEPLHKKDGQTFDIEQWGKWISKKERLTGHEILTGEKPLC